MEFNKTTPTAGPVLSRRQILQVAAAASTCVAITGCQSTTTHDAPAVAFSQTPECLSLAGAGWTLQQEGETQTIPAEVPGSTYTDLLRAGKIPDPFYRQNNDRVQWVADKNWIYARTFKVSAAMLDRAHVHLQCDGLDTLATIWVNGHQLGTTDNMFRTWTFDVKRHLRPGANTLHIRFASLTPTVKTLSAAYKAKYNIDLSDARCWIRKGPYMWGWDWCRGLLTQGIWKNIEIQAFDSRITDVGILQSHNTDGTVALAVHTLAEGAPDGTRVRAVVSMAGVPVTESAGTLAAGESRIDLTVSQPQLWWPNGMGAHPLYSVKVELIGPNGILDSRSRRIGLRKVEVLPPKDGTAMHVKVNGVPVFVKGADWIPADNLPTRVTPDLLRWYMRTAADCHFNFIRLWGGGYYEEDELFDLCDELGLMLQFEFKFANNVYPVHDDQWMNNLQTELDQQVRRCRNHPSIVIWSGNNEIQDFKGYYHLFGEVIGGTVRRLLPGAFYEVGSGATGSGDIHTWNVWHGNAPFEQYRTVQGFVTEFGMQSFPAPKTVDTYTDAADRDSIHSPVMRYHEMDGTGHGIGIIMHYTNLYFGKTPDDFESALRLTQINQAYGIRYGVEHWRRDMPRSMAATIWQYNDCWPGPTWSMIDYDRRWKTIQYQSRHFFAPVLVSGIPDPATGKAELFVTSDRQTDASGELYWRVTDLAGKELLNGSRMITIPARTSRMAHALDLSDLVKTHGAANLLIWPTVLVQGHRVAENTLFFTRPVELKLNKPSLVSTIRGSGRHYHLRVATDVPALWFWAELRNAGAMYSDNYIHLYPGRTSTIHITLEKPLPPEELNRQLVLRSIYDIAPAMRA